jgi:hypothetical protein
MKRRVSREDYIVAAAFIGATVIRILFPVPTIVVIAIACVLALVVAWLVIRSFARRRKERREDREAAWRTFMDDRSVR